MRRTSATRFLVVLSLLMLVAGMARGESRTVYTLAVQPRFSPIETSRDWMPFLSRLEKDSGLSFQLRQYANQNAFEADVLKGIPDFAYLNPYIMVQAKRTHHYLPILRPEEKLQGLILVRKDSPVLGIDQLNGKSIAFPPPTLFAPSVYMRHLLLEKVKIRFTPIFTGKPQNALRSVLAGEADAASSSNLALRNENPDLKEQFRIIYRTPEQVNFAIAVNPRISTPVRQKFLHAALALKNETEGRQVLSAIQMSSLIEADYARDYQPLEKLHLERYSVDPR